MTTSNDCSLVVLCLLLFDDRKIERAHKTKRLDRGHKKQRKMNDPKRDVDMVPIISKTTSQWQSMEVLGKNTPARRGMGITNERKRQKQKRSVDTLEKEKHGTG